jgi:hypothetical protein
VIDIGIGNWFLNIIERIDPSRHAQDMQVYSSRARRNEPWWRHKAKSKTEIPFQERIFILALSLTIILPFVIGSLILIPWILGW